MNSKSVSRKEKTMNKKERMEAVFNMQTPDVIPVFPRVMAQAIFDMGWGLPDISTQTTMDVDKVAEAFISNIKKYDYDLCFGTYMDHGFGVPTLGGVIEIPEKFGVSVSIKVPPIQKREDWPEVKKKLPLDPLKDDRMPDALKALKIVCQEMGEENPIAPAYYTGICAANILFRDVSDLTLDCVEDPEFVDEICQAATDFSIDWARAQYESGCNSVFYLGDHFGTELISPKMGERYILPYVAQFVETIQKEFGQKTFMHIHGNMQRPKSYALLEKLVKEAGVAGLHLDENHDGAWIRENVVEKLGIPGALIVHGPDPIASGPLEKIDAVVKETVESGGPGGCVLMGPSCQVLPSTPGPNFKVWVDSTHKYGTYPIVA
jgi:uroporphyrinogen-III decarboxylase